MGAKTLPLQTSQPVRRAISIDEVRRKLALQRSVVRTWITTVPERSRADMAALIIREAFLQLAEAIKPDFKLSDVFVAPRGKLDPAARSLANSLGILTKALPLYEASYFLSSLYTTLLPSHQRSSLGAFYTPPALAIRLIELAEGAGIDWSTARVLDPACGGGAFLLPVAERIRSALKGTDERSVLAQISSRIGGLELDPHAAWFAQVGLELQLSDLIQVTGQSLPQLIKVCDTLEEPPKASYDLVIGNPPYGRVNLTVEQRSRYARSLYGHANLYGVFTDIALRWSKPDGIIAYLTPTSVLSGQYFRSLRRLLAKESPPSAIDFVHSRKGVFEDVLQETMLALYKKGHSLGAQVHYLKVQNESETTLLKNGTIQLPNNPEAPWLAPRAPEQSRIAEVASRMPCRLKDWGYHVSTGPLVWNRFKDQLCSQGGKGKYPLIWAESVTADGQFKYRAEKRNHAPYFEARSTDEWLKTSETCILVQRTTAKEQARRLIAAELPAKFVRAHGAVVVENHLNMIRSSNPPKVSASVLAAALNSKIVDEVFRCISGSVAVSAFELEALPLPSPSQMEDIEELVDAGAPKEEIDKALEKLYRS